VINGFLAIDKASSWTSHDVVAKVRGILRQKRVGHAGTLDPSATGLLVLGVGKATRLLRFIQDYEKEYVAKVVFGVATETLDADGAILHREPMSFDEDELADVIGRFIGTIAQVPPMVSAVRVGGTRLYELAREGKEVERAPRTVKIYDIDVLDFAPGPYPEAVLTVRCGAGTYVRSLAADIGQALGGGAHIGSLRRTRIGWFDVDSDAVTIEGFGADPERFLVSMSDGLSGLPAVRVDDETAAAVGHGARFGPNAFESQASRVRVTDSRGELLAVYERQDGRWNPQVVVA
jgi:tRNA pseudouridine55 synthase